MRGKGRLGSTSVSRRPARDASASLPHAIVRPYFRPRSTTSKLTHESAGTARQGEEREDDTHIRYLNGRWKPCVGVVGVVVVKGRLGGRRSSAPKQRTPVELKEGTASATEGKGVQFRSGSASSRRLRSASKREASVTPPDGCGGGIRTLSPVLGGQHLGAMNEQCAAVRWSKGNRIAKWRRSCVPSRDENSTFTGQ